MSGAAGAARSAPRAIVPHNRPCLGDTEVQAALRVLHSGRMAPGAEAARLERLLTRLAEGSNAVALSSGTMALTLALRALGLARGDRVAIPSYTCAAVLHAVRAAGVDPVVCDVDAESLTLDPRDLQRRHPVLPRAVVLVHPFGMPARVEPFRTLGLVVVEDCAQALGALDRRRPVGSRGDAAIFSFGPTKPFTCGGPGGAVAAPQAGVVRVVRDLAHHDEKSDDRPRVNGLMGDLHAAIAAAQIERLAELRARREAIARRYDAALTAAGWTRVAAPADSRPMPFRYLLRVADATAVVARLNERGVMARRPVYLPLHRLLHLPGAYPGSERAHAELVSLPLSPALEDVEVERVIEEVRRCRRSPS
jgi:perosamine synthetase